MSRRRRHQLQPGGHFRATRKDVFGVTSPMIWQIESVVTSKDGFDHARLVRVGNPNERKFIAVDALFDRTLFEPLRNP